VQELQVTGKAGVPPEAVAVTAIDPGEPEGMGWAFVGPAIPATRIDLLLDGERAAKDIRTAMTVALGTAAV